MWKRSYIIVGSILGLIYRFRKYGAGNMEHMSILNDWVLAETYLNLYTITYTVM